MDDESKIRWLKKLNNMDEYVFSDFLSFLRLNFYNIYCLVRDIFRVHFSGDFFRGGKKLWSCRMMLKRKIEYKVSISTNLKSAKIKIIKI